MGLTAGGCLDFAITAPPCVTTKRLLHHIHLSPSLTSATSTSWVVVLKICNLFHRAYWRCAITGVQFIYVNLFLLAEASNPARVREFETEKYHKDL